MYITLKNLTFSKESLESYYDSYFHEDLCRYFKVENTEDGAEVIKNIKERGATFLYSMNILKRKKSVPAALFYAQGLSPKTGEGETKNGSLEEEFLFMALVDFMYSTEKCLAFRIDSDEKELIECMNDFGFPWINYVRNNYRLSTFLDESGISNYIVRNKELEVLRKAMQIVEPFMMDKLTQHLSTWKNGYFNNQKYKGYLLISEEIREGLFTLFRRFYTYAGLTGLRFNHDEFANYYENNFFHQLGQYFDVDKRSGKCSQILGVSPHENKRFEDGNPGNTVAENFMFSGMFLYMIITEQAILKFNEKASDDFHQASGWPLISSGPGGGPYLQPLYFLEYAGLLPKKSETILYMEMVNELFPFMQQKTNEWLNGKGGIKDTEAGIRFYDATRKQVKFIKKYIQEQTEQIIELLKLWGNCQEESCHELITNQNIPIQFNFCN